MTRTPLAALFVALILTVTGCSSTVDDPDGSVAEDPPAGTNADDEAPSDDTEVEEPTEEPEAVMPTFGEAFSYDDGLTVTVSAPEPFKYSYPEEFTEGEQTMRFTITIVNNTGATFDPTSTSVSMQSGNEEAAELFDSARGLEGSPVTPLLDGRETVYDVGFALKDPNDLVMQFSPDWERDPVIFVS